MIARSSREGEGALSFTISSMRKEDDKRDEGQTATPGTVVPGAEAAGSDVLTSQDKFKFAGLIVFALLLVAATVLLWTFFDQLATEAGRAALIQQVRNAGFWGVFIVLGLQMLQIVVAVIPGEVLEIIGGVIYGPWLGTLVIMVGVVLASAGIFLLVRKLGYPFVSKVVSQKNLNRFKWLNDSKRLGLIVFLLYLCPGLPKDVLCYLVPLTDMPMLRYLGLSALGRLPGCMVLAFIERRGRGE